MVIPHAAPENDTEAHLALQQRGLLEEIAGKADVRVAFRFMGSILIFRATAAVHAH